MEQNISNQNSTPSNQPKKSRFCCLKIFIAIALVFIIALIGLGWAYYKGYLNTCHIPIKYSIGNVDNRFKISSDEVKKVAEDASNRWNSSTANNLFEYDPNSSFKINLIYDQRQADLDKMNAEITKMNASSSSIESFSSQLGQKIDQYQKDLSEYNSEVSYWNGQGGAPPEKYQELQNRQSELESRKNSINQEAGLLNLQIDEHNSNLDQLKSEVDSQKNKIVTQGEYKGDRIDIYTFGNSEELRLVLMHELGHALTTDHAQDSKSIMFYLLNYQDLADPKLTTEDLELIRSKCRI